MRIKIPEVATCDGTYRSLNRQCWQYIALQTGLPEEVVAREACYCGFQGGHFYWTIPDELLSKREEEVRRANAGQIATEPARKLRLEE